MTAPEPWYEHHALAFTQATDRLRQGANPMAPLLADAVQALGDWLIAITMHDVNNARMAWEPQQDVNRYFEHSDRQISIQVAALRQELSARLDQIEQRLDSVTLGTPLPPERTQLDAGERPS